MGSLELDQASEAGVSRHPGQVPAVPAWHAAVTAAGRPDACKQLTKHLMLRACLRTCRL
jgi:hypothetical protein